MKMPETEEALKRKILEKYKSFRAFASANDLNVMTLTNILNKGITFAGSINVYKICKGLDIDFESLVNGKIKSRIPNAQSINKNEYDLLNKYRQLDEFGQNAVDDLVKNEFERVVFYKNNYKFVYKPFPDMPVSAGSGIDLQSDGQETLKIYKTREADECDFVLRVRGDSMEPKFSDGDVVLVKSQPAVDIGQIGIFIVNGEGYMKELGIGKLISLNENYRPIKIKPSDEMITVGLVLGKAMLG